MILFGCDSFLGGWCCRIPKFFRIEIADHDIGVPVDTVILYETWYVYVGFSRMLSPFYFSFLDPPWKNLKLYNRYNKVLISHLQIKKKVILCWNVRARSIFGYMQTRSSPIQTKPWSDLQMFWALDRRWTVRLRLRMKMDICRIALFILCNFFYFSPFTLSFTPSWRRRRSSGELRQLQRRISGKGTPTYSSSSSSSTVPVRSTRPRRRGRRPAVSASDCLLSRRIRGQIDGGHVGGRLPAGAQGGAEARRRGDSKKHFREFVASEFRRPTGTDADARARLRLAGDYAYLLASVHHHKVGAISRCV